MKKKAEVDLQDRNWIECNFMGTNIKWKLIMDLRIIYIPKTSFSAIQYTDGIQKVKIELK